ncbi:MAG TPA: hypothetical protein VGB65_05730, partial [Allosphingosinicella sp.]
MNGIEFVVACRLIAVLAIVLTVGFALPQGCEFIEGWRSDARLEHPVAFFAGKIRLPALAAAHDFKHR